MSPGGRAEAGLHAEQVDHRHLIQARIGVARQVGFQQRGDPLVDAFEDPFVDGDANQGGDHRFGGRLDVGRRGGAVPTVAALSDHLALAGDDQSFQWRQAFGPVDYLLQARVGSGLQTSSHARLSRW